MKTGFHALCRRAGIEDLRVHDLRRTLGSWMAMQGASLPMIGGLLGHADPQTTARYVHLVDKRLHELNGTVGAAISSAMNGTKAAKRRATPREKKITANNRQPQIKTLRNQSVGTK